ncbi:MAG TPA: hypothetical protein VFU89_06355 [Rhabdochlamydiaceae bacterium]|nr:hypothetical protein [Rhabdochlamydiaceae bacterium]
MSTQQVTSPNSPPSSATQPQTADPTTSITNSVATPILASSASTSTASSATLSSTGLPQSTDTAATTHSTSSISTSTASSTTLSNSQPPQSTDAVATTHSTSSTSTSTASSTTLSSVQSPPDPLIERVEKAFQLLSKRGRQEEARNLFAQLIIELLQEELENDRSHVHQHINCHIGIALTYPEASEERKKAASAAKKIVDCLLTNTIENRTEKAPLTEILYEIRKFYISIGTLVPKDRKFHEQIAGSTALCTKYISLLDNFYFVLEDASTLLAQNNREKARELALEALPSLSGDTPEINLAKAQGHTLIAETFDKSTEDANENAKKAKTLALTAYENRGVKTPDVPFYVAYIIDLFSRLSLLLPEDTSIKETLQECTKNFTNHCAMSLNSSSITPASWFKTAHTLINYGQLDVASLIFSELLIFYENSEDNALLLVTFAQCRIGLACTCADGSSEKKIHLNKAKAFLDTALENSLEEAAAETTTKDFRNIKALYRTIKDLDPHDLNLRDAIMENINTCTDHIPPLSNFYDELTYAQTIPTEKREQAIEIVSKALKTLTKDEPLYHLARAEGHTLIAEMGSDDTKMTCALALTCALKAYENYAESFKKNHQLGIYKQFIELFSRLSELLSDDPAIKEKLVEYMRKLHEQVSHKNRGKNDHKVSNEPAGDHWKHVRLFVAFFFATTVIVGIGVFLGRRAINKLN